MSKVNVTHPNIVSPKVNDSVATSIFAHKVRVRACGVLINEDQILLIKHRGVGKKGHLWIPPGGGVEFGQTLEETIIREFLEETGLEIQVNQLIYINEHIDDRFHGLEFFFLVKPIDSNFSRLKKGIDPELENTIQIIEDLAWIKFSDLQKMDSDTIHIIFNQLRYPDDFFKNTPFLNLGRIP